MIQKSTETVQHSIRVLSKNHNTPCRQYQSSNAYWWIDQKCTRKMGHFRISHNPANPLPV